MSPQAEDQPEEQGAFSKLSHVIDASTLAGAFSAEIGVLLNPH